MESTSGVIDDLVTFGDEDLQFVADHLSHVVAHPEIILSTLDKVILRLDDISEVSNFIVPLFADGTGLSGHGGHTSEGLSPVVEISHEGFSFSLVFGDLTLKDTSTDSIASSGGWWEDDTSGTSTINLGSHVFFPVVEFSRFTFGSFSEMVSGGFHFGFDGDQLFAEG